MMQLIAIIIILAIAVALAARHIWRMVKGKSDPCRGCALADSCKKKGCQNCADSCHKC